MTIGRPRKHSTSADRQRAYRKRQARDFRNATALQNEPELFQVDRPPVRYYGGKWRVGNWVIEQFPPHKCYVEPFCGGASVLLQKSPAWVEVLNDLNDDVIAFFDCLRDRPAELVRAILLTPYSREELRRARIEAPANDRLEKARRFYIRQWQSYGSGVGKSSTGWRFQVGNGGETRANAVGSWNRIEHLWAAAKRLKMVQIEHDDAFKVIERFDGPGTLFYVDPPYVHETRYHSSPSKGYAFEMTDEDHRRLAGVLKSVRGMVVLSGYPSGLYDELFSGWKRLEREVQDINSAKKTECLWLSPRTAEISSMPLFADRLET